MATARRTDPAGSHCAAREAAGAEWACDHRTQVLEALMATTGYTAPEIADSLGLRNDQVQRRLNDLRLAGLARPGANRKCTITQRTCQTWTLAPATTQGRLFE